MKTENEIILYYIQLFGKLRRAHSNGVAAPHKPVLLISVIQAFQQKLLTSDEISITPELLGLFKENWTKLVTTQHQCRFALPFFHMKSEKFWQLKAKEGLDSWVNSKGSISSISSLTKAIRYAKIDAELADLLLNENNAQFLLNFILEKYFPEAVGNTLQATTNYLNEIELQILKEPHFDYQQRLKKLKEELDVDTFQEEVFIRSNIFKREVPKMYHFTCCISELKVDSSTNVSMIDACHIIPFSESFNDTISNGISLCPNLHRAFDRGLISIDHDYKVIVNNNFIESDTPYNLKQFKGKRIILPENKAYYPAPASLNHHHERFGFK